MGCSRPCIMRTKQLSTLVILIQLWQTTSGADPQTIIQSKVMMCFCCNETTAYFNWTHLLKPLLRIQWKFEEIYMANYTNSVLDFTQESLRISPNYKDRFHLLQQGGVGFRLNYVTRADIGTYRLLITLKTLAVQRVKGDLEEIDQQSGDFNIMVNNQGKLTCGESRDSTYSWIFSNTTGRENETSTGHELSLSSIPQKGSVYCLRHSDCTRSSPYNFSSEADNHGFPIAVIIAVIPAIFIVLTIFIVVRRKKTK